jgi:hypothetical protein
MAKDTNRVSLSSRRGSVSSFSAPKKKGLTLVVVSFATTFRGYLILSQLPPAATIIMKLLTTSLLVVLLVGRSADAFLLLASPRRSAVAAVGALKSTSSW